MGHEPDDRARQRAGDYWRRTATDFDRHYGARGIVGRFLRQRQEMLAALVPETRGLAVADIGCGSGIQLAALAPEARLAVGLDISEGMVARASQRVPLAVQADVHGLPLASGAFDLVLAMGLLDYTSDASAALAELVRVTRPGGTLVFSVPRRPSLFEPLRSGPGLWLRERFFHLPPILVVLERDEVLTLVDTCGCELVELRSLWTATWMVRAVRAS